MATRRSSVRIDMTPMVDVAFLLLIFFMTTTQFKAPESVAVELPLSRSEIHVPETGTIILTVNRTGQMFISSENVADAQEMAPDNALHSNGPRLARPAGERGRSTDPTLRVAYDARVDEE